MPPSNDIKIPAYYVDHKVGLELYYQLEKMAGVPLATIPTFDHSHLTTRISVRIALLPADNIKPTAWELTLLVMLILLGTSIIFSGTFYISFKSICKTLIIFINSGHAFLHIQEKQASSRNGRTSSNHSSSSICITYG